MTIFKTGKPPDDAREVIAMGDHMGVPILGARKPEITAPRGQAGAETKYQKRHVRLFICHICGERGGTLVRQGEKYRHLACRGT